MSAFISLTEAVQMTTDYRNSRESILATAYQGQNILAICETFDKDQVLQLLNETGCEKLRIYFGMDTGKKVHSILVGVDADDIDILPPGTSLTVTEEDELILEKAFRCPETCPPDSELNT
ncbi:MAG: hypothetical protein ACO1OO_04355 [Flavisolibacter sp.]